MPLVAKKIAVLGLGDEGRDVLNWLKINSANCRIKTFDKIKTADLSGYDIIFRSPGFWRLSPMLRTAEARGALISSATKLFFELCPAKIIGVTGTKGKGTTSTLIYKMLKAAGKNTFLAGNIGKPMLKLLPRLKAGDWVCLELSSFQLQDLNASPHLAVVLDIRSDHLNVHRHLAEYRRAKENILRFQKPTDFAVINADYLVTRKMARLTRAKVVWFSRKDFPLDLAQVKLRGVHNQENIGAALAAAGVIGIDPLIARETAAKFKGLEHRLELVRQVGGISWYNDSFSTTPETAIAAIKSFDEPMTVILGGSEKGSNYRGLGRVIVTRQNVKNLILIGVTAPKIRAAAKGFTGKIITGLTRMEAVVKTAARLSRPGSVVVLSPACASFDLFENYKDRGEQFKLWVKKL